MRLQRVLDLAGESAHVARAIIFGSFLSDKAEPNDVDLFPGAQIRWGLGYMLNLQPGPNGRSAGTVSWGGIFNTYYWLDPAKRVTGLIMTQILPFADQRALKLYGQFESAVYEALPSA